MKLKDESKSSENQGTNDDEIIRDLVEGMRACEHNRQWQRLVETTAELRKSSSDSVVRLMWGLSVGYRNAPPGVSAGPSSYSLLRWGEKHILQLWRKCGTEGADLEERRTRAAAVLGVDVATFCSWIEAEKAAGRKGFL